MHGPQAQLDRAKGEKSTAYLDKVALSKSGDRRQFLNQDTVI